MSHLKHLNKTHTNLLSQLSINSVKESCKSSAFPASQHKQFKGAATDIYEWSFGAKIELQSLKQD